MARTILSPMADPGPWGKPKGSGGNGPTGGGWPPGGRGPKGSPPELDDVLKHLKQQYNDFFGGEHGNRGVLLALAALILLWLASGIYQLQPGEEAVVLRFGKMDHIATSGLRYHLPAPFETIDIVKSEAVRMETLGVEGNGLLHGDAGNENEILMLTGDENIIDLSFSVQWKVRDPQAFVFNLPNPAQTVRDVTESAMREVVGRTTLDATLTEGKSKVQEETLKLTQETLDHYKAGIQILQVNLLDASFPQAVVGAAHDVQAALADQESARNEAQAYTNDILPRARGQAERKIQEAEAYKQEVVAKAEGEAARFTSVYAQYKQAEDITRKRIYLETMEKILAGMPKVIIDSKGAAAPYLPLPIARPLTEDRPDKETQP